MARLRTRSRRVIAAERVLPDGHLRRPQTTRSTIPATTARTTTVARTRAATRSMRLRRFFAGAAATAASSSSALNTCVFTAGTRSSSSSVSSSGSRSGSGSSTAGRTAVSSGAAAPSSAISKNTTVMLSSPPPRLARTTSSRAAPSRSRRCSSIASRIAASPTIEVRPSEQSRNTSPGCDSIVYVSTSTSGSVPRARVITERCGCDSASSGESLPLRISSATSEWSCVSCSSMPSRTR